MSYLTAGYRGKMVDRAVLNRLAYERRTLEEQRPLTALWMRGKQVLRNLTQ